LKIADTKTRMSLKPVNESQKYAHGIQVSLYYRLLMQMVLGEFDFMSFCDAAKIDPTKVLSDSFIAQAVNIIECSCSNVISIDALFQQPDLENIWNLNSIQLAQLQGKFSTDLDIVYRLRDATVLQTDTIKYDEERLQRHLLNNLEWWQGRRQAKGVDLADTFKCYSCAFMAGCSWRAEKAKEVTDLRGSKEKGTM